MAIYSTIVGAGVEAYPAKMCGTYAIDGVVDFSTVNGTTGTVQNDVITVLQIPANTLVLGVAYKTTTVSANLADVDIGDGAVTDGYVDGLDMTTSLKDGCSWVTTFNEAAPNTTADGMSLGKFYTAADTIDLKQNTNATIKTGVIKVRAICISANLD
jgi:hypothetical protein